MDGSNHIVSTAQTAHINIKLTITLVAIILLFVRCGAWIVCLAGWLVGWCVCAFVYAMHSMHRDERRKNQEMKSILKAYRDTIVYKEEEIGCHCCYYLLALNANSIDYIAFDSEFLLLLARIHTALVQRVHIYKCSIKRLLTTTLCINKFTLLLFLSLSLPPPSQSLCLVIFIFNFNSKFLCAKSIDSRALNTR